MLKLRTGAIVFSLFLSTVLGAGCSGSGDTFQGSDPGAAQSVQTGQLTLRFDDTLPDVAPRLLESATRYQIEVYDGNGDVVASQTVDRTPTDIQEVQVPGVPFGLHQLLVSGLDAEGNRVGFFGQEVEIGFQPTQVLVTTLTPTGQTREVGRVSIQTTGTQSTVASDSVALSGDGRFAAFVTAARLDGGHDTNLHRDVYVRDRVAGTTLRVSFAPDPTGLNPFGDLGANCEQPDVSDSGNQVVFVSRDELYMRSKDTLFVGGIVTTRTSTLRLDPTSIVDGGRTFTIQSIQHPIVSATGRFVTYEAQLFLGGSNFGQHVLLHDRTNRTTEIVSKGIATVQGGLGPAPVSSDGRFVYYTSLTGTGGRGVALRDRQALTTTFVATLPSNPAPGASLATSADGRIVLVADTANVRVVDLDTRTTEVLLASPPLGRAALSRDGRFAVFQSAAAGLVPNDQNGVADVFVVDRATGRRSRVNVAGDGFSVEGGLVADRGPDLSADGSRVGFSSADSLVVPGDTNGVADVFTAGVPRNGLLYVSGGPSIHRVPDAASADGEVATKEINGPDTGLVDALKLVHDAANDRLYVLNLNPAGDEILVFEKASTAGGNVKPSRRIRIQADGGGIASIQDFTIDFQRDLLYAQAQRVVRIPGASTAKGDVAAAAGKFMNARTVFVDSRRNELYVGTDTGATRRIQVLPASTFTSTTPALRTLDTPKRPLGFAFDIGPRGSGGSLVNFANLVTLFDPGLDAGSGLHTFDGNGSNPLRALAFPALRVVNGSTAFGASSVTVGQPGLDRTNGDLYLPVEGRVRIFRGDATGDAAPARLLTLPVGTGLSGLAVDMTR